LHEAHPESGAVWRARSRFGWRAGVAAPTAVLIRPDGYVAWVGDRTQRGLTDALTTWFGPPAAI